MFPSRDGRLAIHVFGYVRQEPEQSALPARTSDNFGLAEAVPPSTTKAGKARRAAAAEAAMSAAAAASPGASPSSELLEYAASVQAGEWAGNDAHAPPAPMVSVSFPCFVSVAFFVHSVRGGGGRCNHCMMHAWP